MKVEIVDERCRKCGKPASEACSGCKSALCCSTACQRWDWEAAGHKSLCQAPAVNRHIHVILRNLFHAEWTWLQNLCKPERELFFKTPNDSLNHILLAGEVALVLSRANPSAMLSNHALHTIEFGLVHYSNVILPWCN